MKIGFLGLLGLLFIGLKLSGVIAWSWWLVLLPLYGGVVLWVIVFAIMLFALAAGNAVGSTKRRF